MSNAIETNIKMENILEKFIIYLKDTPRLEDETGEFDYGYVEYVLLFISDRNHYKDAYTYFKELIYYEFERAICDECYDDIILILNDYRGDDDDEYYEGDENIQVFIDENLDTDEDIWNANELYKFEKNMCQYVEYLLQTDSKNNKIEFIKNIIDCLNNPIYLK
jgi:hypothetical protein